MTRVKHRPNDNNLGTWVNTIFSIMTLGMIQDRKTSKRPFIQVRANGSDSPWLFDTGAEVCCMNVNEFRRIHVDNRPQKIQVFQDLRCASKNKLNVKGTYLMNLEILGRKIQQVVFVCKNLGQSAILGIDAIEKLGLVYSARSKKIFL